MNYKKIDVGEFSHQHHCSQVPHSLDSMQTKQNKFLHLKDTYRVLNKYFPNIENKKSHALVNKIKHHKKPSLMFEPLKSNMQFIKTKCLEHKASIREPHSHGDCRWGSPYKRTFPSISNTYSTPEPSKSLFIGLTSPSLHVAHVVFHTPVERGQPDGDFIGFEGIKVITNKVKNFQFLFFFFFALLIFFRTEHTSGCLKIKKTIQTKTHNREEKTYGKS